MTDFETVKYRGKFDLILLGRPSVSWSGDVFNGISRQLVDGAFLFHR